MKIRWVWPIGVHTVDSLEQLPKDAVVLSVNGIPAVGRCKSCGEPITVIEEYRVVTHDNKSYVVCAKCTLKEADLENARA